MTLDDIYQRAEQVKPAFDAKITNIAAIVNGTAVLSELKLMDRANEKVNIDYDGDASKIRDVLRASIVMACIADIDAAYDIAFKEFNVVENNARNGYASQVHSSDGYFDAKMDIISWAFLLSFKFIRKQCGRLKN